MGVEVPKSAPSVEVWVADPDVIGDVSGTGPSAWFSSEERTRLEATLDGRLRDQRRVAYGLARWAVARRLGQRPEEVAIARDDDGRPELVRPPGSKWKIGISLAHTDGLVVCALAESASLGVDVERRRAYPGAGAVARRFFRPEEVAALEATSEPARSDHFWALWTLKEALVKAAGLDLFEGLGACAFRIDDLGRVEHELSAAARAPADDWRFALLAPTRAHCVAVAARARPGVGLSIRLHDATADLTGRGARSATGG